MARGVRITEHTQGLGEMENPWGFWAGTKIWVVVSNVFYFHPLFGEDAPILTNIFQMGWNHQLEIVSDGFTMFQGGFIHMLSEW